MSLSCIFSIELILKWIDPAFAPGRVFRRKYESKGASCRGSGSERQAQWLLFPQSHRSVVDCQRVAVETDDFRGGGLRVVRAREKELEFDPRHHANRGAPAFLADELLDRIAPVS